MGKAILIILLGTMITFGVLNLNINTGLNLSTDKSLEYYAEAGARNISNSVAQMLIAKLGDDKSYRVNSQVSAGLMGGTASYTVINDIAGTDTLVKINVTGTYMGVNHQLTVRVKFPDPGSPIFPGGVMAAITTNNPVLTLGKLVVDGREHDINGNVLSNKGTKGIWTTSSFSRSGSSTVGGTYNKIDYPPAKSYNSNIVATEQKWGGGNYPNTPEGVMGGPDKGYSEGKLKALAMSHTKGSQYVTDPSSLTYPLKGITYIELGNNQSWQSMDIEGSGILIVHNSQLNAQMKNLNSGTFKGLIIADDLVHIHADIIGAVVCLSPNPSEGNCIGNGNGTVRYSAQAIYSSVPLTEGEGSPGFGLAKHRVEIIDWYE